MKCHNHFCLLKKPLYCLKRSHRQWKFDTFVLSVYKRCFYFCFEDNMSVYILLYVNHTLLISRSAENIARLKRMLSTAFQMKDIGKAKKIMGMTIERNGE